MLDLFALGIDANHTVPSTEGRRRIQIAIAVKGKPLGTPQPTNICFDMPAHIDRVYIVVTRKARRGNIKSIVQPNCDMKRRDRSLYRGKSLRRTVFRNAIYRTRSVTDEHRSI